MSKREDNSGDVFGYDRNDQVIACWLDILNPDTTPPGDQTIFYDGAGNRTAFNPYEWLVGYTTNNLNEYTQRNFLQREDPRPTPTPRPRPTPAPRPTPPGQQAATYDYAGNMSAGFDGSNYTYDAQNRLISATCGSATMTFAYDGLNRQVSQAVNGATTFSVWDGWDLIEEYQSGNNVTARYLYGPNGIVKNLTNGNSYFQDGSGSTSYLTDGSGNLLEFYLYDLQGTPSFYDQNGNPLLASAYGVRHLFTGQQWYAELGLYDLRYRSYSPDVGRFLQPDPISFWGDPTNLYRYVRNNPVNWRDPLGLDVFVFRIDLSGLYTLPSAEVERVIVNGGGGPTGGNPSGGNPGINFIDVGIPSWGGPGGPGGSGEPGGAERGGREKGQKGGPDDKKTPKDNTPQQNPNQPNQPNQPNTQPNQPAQNQTTPSPSPMPQQTQWSWTKFWSFGGLGALGGGIAGIPSGWPGIAFGAGGGFLVGAGGYSLAYYFEHDDQN